MPEGYTPTKPKSPMTCLRCKTQSTTKVVHPPHKWHSMALYREGWHATQGGDWYCGDCWNS
jgi:hypothetical protein